MKVSFGITTVPERKTDDVLKDTLLNLWVVGIDSPVEAVDANHSGVCQNWLSLAQYLCSEFPDSDAYCIFQDDIHVVPNLLDFLTDARLLEGAYLNLYTSPINRRNDLRGWYEPNVPGQGALGLVISRQALLTLLNNPRAAAIKQDKEPKKGIDGLVNEVLTSEGYKELCHYPSLIAHTGSKSTIGNSYPIDGPLESIHPTTINVDSGYKSQLRSPKRVEYVNWSPHLVNPEDTDLAICRTTYSYYYLQDLCPSVYVPFSVDTDSVAYFSRGVCKTFLYIHPKEHTERNYRDPLIHSLASNCKDINLRIYTDTPNIWPKRCVVDPDILKSKEEYLTGDILICTDYSEESFNHLRIATSLGIPVITPNALPWNDFPSIARISVKDSISKSDGSIFYSLSFNSLIGICQELLSEDISVASKIIRKWAESRSVKKYDSIENWIIDNGVL